MTKQKKSFLDKIISTNKKGKKQNSESINFEKDNENNEDTLSEIEATEKTESEIDKKEDDNSKESGDNEEGQLTIDVYQNDEFIIIKSIIGGARPDDLDISITNDMVTIKGVRKNPDEIKAKDYYYQECFWGNFSRSVILPCDVRVDEAKAAMKNGILTVKLPKIEKNSSMKIKIEEE